MNVLKMHLISSEGPADWARTNLFHGGTCVWRTEPTGPDQQCPVGPGDARRGTPVLGCLCGALTNIKTLVHSVTVTNTHLLLSGRVEGWRLPPLTPSSQSCDHQSVGWGACGGARSPGTGLAGSLATHLTPSDSFHIIFPSSPKQEKTKML